MRSACRNRSRVERGSGVAAAVDDVADDQLVVGGEIEDEVLPDGVAAETGDEVVSRSPQVGEGGEVVQGSEEERPVTVPLRRAPPLQGVLEQPPHVVPGPGGQATATTSTA